MEQGRNIFVFTRDEALSTTVTKLLENAGHTVRISDEIIADAVEGGNSIFIIDCPLMDKEAEYVFTSAKQKHPFIKIVGLVPRENGEIGSQPAQIAPYLDAYLLTPITPAYLVQQINMLSKIMYFEDACSNELAQLKEQSENKLQHKTNELTLLFEIGREITSSLSLDEVLTTIVERITNVLSVERCSILLLEANKEKLYIAAAKGISEKIIKETRLKRGESISGWVINNKKSLMIADVETSDLFRKKNEEQYYTGSFISVPLLNKGKPIGVINVNNKRTKSSFTEDDLRLIEGIADQAAIAIENAQLYQNLQGIYLQIISTLTQVIEIKDHYTKGHSERVTRYAVALAQAISLAREKVQIIELACQLHDLGKIGVHEYILTKPGRLTFEEWNEIKLHPVNAAEILKPLTFLNEVIKLIEQHHERFDGKGYPHGDKAEDINLGARIMAVADSYDAMTTNRPYAKIMTPEEAVAEIQRCSGAQYDPEIVEAFVSLFKSNPELFRK